MSKTPLEIIVEIDTYMRKYAYQNSAWYVGIASDPRKRLFTDHRVNEQTGIWIYVQTSSVNEAREIEKAYLDTGHDGGCGGGDYSTTYVYAYVKFQGTVR